MGYSVLCACGEPLEISAADAGRELACGACGRPVTVPALSGLRAGAAERPVVPPADPLSSREQARAKRADVQRFRRSIHPGRPVVTGLAAAVSVLVFARMTAAGVPLTDPPLDDLIAWGALFGPRVGAGEWWRVLTGTALHSGPVHLLLNVVWLVALGRWVEPMVGRAATAAVYLLAAVGGSLASLAWEPTVVAVGASGAVFGLAGALAALTLRGWPDLPPAARADLRGVLLYGLVANLVLGFFVPRVDNAAHLGGLLAGLAAGALLDFRLPGRDDGPTGERTRTTVVVLGLALGVAAGVVFAGLWGMTDWRADLAAVGGLEQRAIAAQNALAAEAGRNQVTDAQFADRSDREVLPLWREARAVADRTAPPRQLRPVVGRLRDYLRVRVEAAEALAAAARAGDEAGVRAATDRIKEADRLAQALDAEWGRLNR